MARVKLSKKFIEFFFLFFMVRNKMSHFVQILAKVRKTRPLLNTCTHTVLVNVYPVYIVMCNDHKTFLQHMLL